MFKRHFRRFVLLCLLVNATSGSPQFQGWDQQARHLRHASCPSCRRERPDALVSWDIPPRREYRELEPEISRWQVSEPFRPNPIYYSSPYNNPYNNPYNRATRSRGTPTTTTFRDTYKRENPFINGRNLNFDVAVAQTSPVHSLSGSVPPSFPYQPNFPIPRSPARTPYRKSSFYDPIKSQSDFLPVNKYAEYNLNNNVSPFDDIKRYTNPYGNVNRDFEVIYNAENRFDDSFEEENPMIVPEPYPRRQNPYSRNPIGVRMQEMNQFLQPRRVRIEETKPIHRQEIKPNPYKLTPNLNVFRMAQNVPREEAKIVNNRKWQKQFEEDGEKEPENHSDLKIDEDVDQTRIKMAKEMNDGHEEDGRFNFNEGEEVKEKRNAGSVTSTENLEMSSMNSSQTELSEIEINTEPDVVEVTIPPLIAA